MKDGWNVVGNTRGSFDVIFNGQDVKGGFATKELAWHWIDQYPDDEPFKEHPDKKVD